VENVPNGEALISGPVVDQAALHGLLIRIRDLGLPLLSVLRIGPKDDTRSDAENCINCDNLKYEGRV
jgi:hypothetical protein